jgi:glutathione peroxidase-family protein
MAQKERHEYKSVTLSPQQEKDFLEGKFNGKLSMVYNGAYKAGALERYSRVEHCMTLYSEATGMQIAVIRMPTDDVIRQLKPKVERILEGTHVGTTNCNSAYYEFVNSQPEKGEIVWMVEK